MVGGEPRQRGRRPVFLGFISAVAFATILAVVAGLTLAGASAVSHDLYAQVIARGRTTEKHEVNISKIAAVVIGIVAIYLGYVFENQNVAFMVGLAFAVAASCNFPVLAMSILWRGTTTWGALAGGLVGLVTAVMMVVLSKAVWVATLGHPAAIFPYDNPALFSMPIAFAAIWVVSMLDKSRGPSASAPPSMRNSSARRPASARPAPTRTERPGHDPIEGARHGRALFFVPVRTPRRSDAEVPADETGRAHWGATRSAMPRSGPVRRNAGFATGRRGRGTIADRPLRRTG